MTIAELGIKIDSGDAPKAAANLDLIPPAAGRAEISTKQLSFQMRNLALQMPDVAQGILSGQGAMQVLVQQGFQVVQIMQMGPGGVGGSLRAVTSAMMDMLTPTRLLALGLGGIAAAAAVSAVMWKSYALQLDDLSKSTNATAEDLSRLQRAASLKGISTTDFEAGMRSLSKATYEAKSGAGDLAKVLEWNLKPTGDLIQNLESVADLIMRAKGDAELQFSIMRQSGIPTTIDWLRYMEGVAEAAKKTNTEANAFASNKEMVERARAFSEALNKGWDDAIAGVRNWGGEVVQQFNIIYNNPAFQAIYRLLTMTPKQLAESVGPLITMSSPGFNPSDYQTSASQFGLSLPGNKGSYMSAYQSTPIGQKYAETQGKPIDPDVMERGIKQTLELADSVNKLAKEYTAGDKAANALAESMRKLSEQRTTALEKAQRETAELLSFTGASKAAALAQAELAKYRERNIAVTPQLEAEIRAWAQQVAAVRELNQAIRSVKDSAVDFAQSLVSGLMQGQNLMQSLGGAAKSLGSSLTNSGIQNLMSGNLLLGGAQTAVGLVASLFGNNQAKKQQQQQATQQQLQEQQRAAQQAAQQAQQLAEQQAEQARQDAERRLQAEIEFQQKLDDLRKSAADREFAALNDNASLAGRLAEYDRKALQEREDTLRDFGQVTVELERAQAAERGRILKDALREQIDYYSGLRRTISDFIRGTNFGNLSALSPAEQFMSARNDFQNQLALAQGGDRTAQGSITNVAQTLLEQARSFLGPSVAFGELKDRVTEQLRSLTDIAMSNDTQMQELQRMGAYTGQLVQLQSANNESAEEIIAELSRMRLDLKQGLAAIKLRAA